MNIDLVRFLSRLVAAVECDLFARDLLGKGLPEYQVANRSARSEAKIAPRTGLRRDGVGVH